MYRFDFTAIAVVVMAGFMTFPITGQARDIEVMDRSDGGVDVEFPNGCFINYDRYGNRGAHQNRCKNQQLERADEAVKNHMDNHGSTSGDSVPEAQMQRYCQGEASAELNERPNYISTLPVERMGSQYVVYGQSPPSGSNATTFECTFNKHGVFRGVEVTMRPNQGGNNSGSNGLPSRAERKCLDSFGGSAKVTQVSPLSAGYWEVIMQNNAGTRMAACTVSSSGEIQDWAEMN